MSEKKGLMISCKHATELIEKNQEEQLSVREKIQLRFHNFLCKVCAIYEKQSIMLSKLLSQTTMKNINDVKENDLKNLKEKIILSLDDKKSES
jgi:hypothetical protein